MSLINFNLKVAVSLLIGVVIGALAAHKIPETKAQSSGLSGKYGCISNSNSAPYLQKYTGFNFYMNSAGFFDFDTKKITASQSVASNFNTGGISLSNDDFTIDFTITSGPISGAYTMTISGGSSLIVIPVNSGNTLLLKSITTGPGAIADTGMCQKI